MFFIIAALSLAAGGARSISTFGEEKQCFVDNVFGTCNTECSDKLPADKRKALKACFQGGNGPLAGFQCLSDNGITDEKPCFKKPAASNSFQNGMKHGMGGDSRNTMQMMMAFMSMKDFFMCMKDCAPRQAGQCTEGCAEVDDATMEVLKNCALQDMQSNQGAMQCLMNAAQGK